LVPVWWALGGSLLLTLGNHAAGHFGYKQSWKLLGSLMAVLLFLAMFWVSWLQFERAESEHTRADTAWNRLIELEGEVRKSGVTIHSLQDEVRKLQDEVQKKPIPVEVRFSRAARVHTERPQGVIDGVNRVFTLTREPSDQTQVTVLVDRMPQDPDTDYSILGRTITFRDDAIPTRLSMIRVYYPVR